MPDSPLRQECRQLLEHWVGFLPPTKDILDIGIEGDVKPGGNYYLFLGKNYKTLDIVASLNPDYVEDITALDSTKLPKFDVVILSNVLEHTFEKEMALTNCYHLLRDGGHLIVDIPWQFPYHTSAESLDYWRISKDGLLEMLNRAGFKNIQVEQGQYCTSGIGEK